MMSKDLNAATLEIAAVIDSETSVGRSKSSRGNESQTDIRRHRVGEIGVNSTHQIEFPLPKNNFPSSSGKPGRKSMTDLDKSTSISSPLHFRGSSSIDHIKSSAPLQYKRNDAQFVLYPAALDLLHH